jgi:hypothetical protein
MPPDDPTIVLLKEMREETRESFKEVKQSLKEHAAEDKNDFASVREDIQSVKIEAAKSGVELEHVQETTGRYHVRSGDSNPPRVRWYQGALAKTAQKVLPYIGLVLAIEFTHRCGLPAVPFPEAAARTAPAATAPASTPAR